MIEVSVPETSTVDQFTQTCLAEARSAQLACWPTDPLDVWLVDAVTGKRLEAGQRVTDLDLAEGDVLVLCIEHPPQALYSLAPIPDSAALIRRLQLAEGVLPPDGGPRLWGVLLYTDADAELAAYVRTHFEDLNALSGPATRVFVIERPADWRTAKRYWRKNLEPELYRVLSTMRWLTWQPYDRQGAYEIADLMGVDRDLLPCLVFFHPSGGPLAEAEKVVFCIEDVSVGYFRSLFGGISAALRPADGAPSPSLREQMSAEERAAHSRFEAWFAELQRRDPEWWRGPLPTMPEPSLEETLHTLAARGRGADAEAFARVRSAAQAIRSRLSPAQPTRPDHTHTFHNCRVVVTSGAAVSENFYFQGENTTFINRPQDTVIRDFQNTYGAGADAEDLTRLLELVLSSRDLTDSERNEAAGAVHDVARLSAEPEPDAPAVRTRLQRLRELLSSSADIAQPALAIIASVTALFAG
ncbi:hypothetical protein ABT009_28030 [Streptomyces sp. NPDC002896]|uniref:hypothetical protein n=1 Tax=Streptomyces sp. NPDC002896 TaxID=3154438 RepID=UPI003323D1F9